MSIYRLLDMLDLLEMLDSFRHTLVRYPTHAAAIGTHAGAMANTRSCDWEYTQVRSKKLENALKFALLFVPLQNERK